MANLKALFSSMNDEWETPPEIFDSLNQEFHFTLDVCATPKNAKCARYFAKDQDGLSLSWETNVCWMNPPYGTQIGKWIAKAYYESQNGATVVCLLPARTDTRWFHEYCVKGEIRFLRGRIKFVGANGSAPFPSMVVVFRPRETLD